MQQMMIGLFDGLTTIALAVGPVAAVCWVVWGALTSMGSGGAKVLSEVVTRVLQAVAVLAIVLGAKTIIIPELRTMMGV